MLNWLFGVPPARRGGRPASARPTLENLEDRTVPATTFTQANLVSDLPNVAPLTDPNLRNPWGVAVAPSGDFWVANAGSDTVTLYKGDVNGSAVSRDGAALTTPVGLTNQQISPSGVVFNTTRDFTVANPGYSGPASYFIAGLDGTITAVAPTFSGTTYTTATNYKSQLVAATPNATYTGLALGGNSAGNFLYAADPALGRVDVFNDTFQLVSTAGGFTDPTLPAGFTPFNVADVGGTLYVTYKSTTTPDAGGVIDTFDTNGNFLSRFAAGSNLNVPWAVVQAPAGFGTYGGDLLVGNFGDGHISAYDTKGNYLGQLTTPTAQPVAIERLWQLTFGNGTTAGNADTLYFSAGINGEKDGLFGSLTAATASGTPTPTPSPTPTPTPTPAANPFVQQVYLDLLQRPPSASELNQWDAALSEGVPRMQVVLGVENSTEFRQAEVSNLYERLLHRAPGQQGLDFWVSRLSAGATLETVAAAIASSPEYFGQAGSTNLGFLSALYQDALGRSPDPAGQPFFLARLQQGATRFQVATVIFSSNEFRTNLIESYYQNLLGRGAPGSDSAFWVGVLQRGVRDESVVANFLSSDEFVSKFPQPLTRGSSQTAPAAAPLQTTTSSTTAAQPTASTVTTTTSSLDPALVSTINVTPTPGNAFWY
jgi:uncharacterized protein (TIGR03118 family)